MTNAEIAYLVAGLFVGTAIGAIGAGLLARREIDRLKARHLRVVFTLGRSVEPEEFDWRAIGVGGNR